MVEGIAGVVRDVQSAIVTEGAVADVQRREEVLVLSDAKAGAVWFGLERDDPGIADEVHVEEAIAQAFGPRADGREAQA